MNTLAIDNETFRITRDRPAPPVVCTSWYDGSVGGVLHHTQVRERMAAWLFDSTFNFVGHHVAFDFVTIAATFPDLLSWIFNAYANNRVTDTIIRQQLFDIAVGKTFANDQVRGYSLADLYELIFDKPMPGVEHKKQSVVNPEASVRLRYGNLHHLPIEQWPQEYIDYAYGDAVGTYEVWAEQNKVGHLLRDDPFHAYTMFVLQLASCRGMRCEPAAVRKFKEDNERRLEELRPGLLDAGLLEPKRGGGYVKKDKAARERIAATCAAKGIEPLLTKSKAVSIDRTACHWAEDELMLKRAEYVTAEKMLSTYYPFLAEGMRGPITTRFNLVATGRTSSVRPREPAVGGNFQNMPRKKGARECVVPRPGKLLLAGDFQGAELHCLAQVCKWKLGYSVLGETLKSGRDVHLFVGAELLGIDYDSALMRRKDGDPDVKKARQDAKMANFGFGGAMGVRTFIKTQLKEGRRYSKEEAANLRHTWLRTFPEMQEYFDYCKRELGPKERAQIELLGSPMLRTVRGLSTICNSFFQALAAVGGKRAINEVARRSFCEEQSALFGMRPINFVHDDLTNEVDEDPVIYRPAAAEFEQVMADQFNTVVPDYPTGVDVVLMRRWSKDAEPTFDAEGNLIPCPDDYLQ